MNDDLGDRMKEYESAVTEHALPWGMPIYARLDGRSFSSFTRGMRRPFDERMTSAMVGTTKRLVAGTHARIGYTQSDEISLVWLFDQEGSQPIFGGKVHKLTSVLASMAAAALSIELVAAFGPLEAAALASRMPHFDCRVFSLPSKVEAANAFLWRCMDARKNAVSMAARAYFSPRQLHKADQSRMRAMLAEKGVDFDADFPPFFKWGTWVRRVSYERAFTDAELLAIPEAHRPEPGASVTRSEVRSVDMPEFRTVENRVAVIFDGECPILGRMAA